MTLEQWWNVVQATADFMATVAVKDPKTGLYDLGPPLNDVAERSAIEAAKNPPFEVAYWRFGLKVAKQWRERMGKEPDPLWDDVLAPPSSAGSQGRQLRGEHERFRFVATP